MAHSAGQIRVLAMAPEQKQQTLLQQIRSFGMAPTVVNSAAQLAFYIRTGNHFEVVLLPATLPATEAWWEIWGDVAMLRPKPAVLVYAHTATFQLWSGVLEVGGYDVIVEPLTDRKLRTALLLAAESKGSRRGEDFT